MLEFLIRLVISAGTLLLVSRVVEGIEIHGYFPAIAGAFALGILNALVRPVLLFLTLPLNILTLGLLTFLVNGLMLKLVDLIIRGFVIQGFWPAVWGALLISTAGWLLNLIGHPGRRRNIT